MTVVELIRDRLDSASVRSKRNDPYHLALVIEGGGMRGVVSGGMVTAIEHFGLLSCFDSIHGSSAGACAGAYLAAGQAALGTSIYYEDINNAKFISLARGLIGGPTMSADFLIDYVMQNPKPLDVDRVIKMTGFLHIVATSVENAKPHVFSSWDSNSEFFETLRASILIPIIAGASVEISGRHFVDGGVVQQIAINSAIDVGATHILVLLTRTADELERKSTPIFHGIERNLLKYRYGQAIADAYDSRSQNINSVIREIQSGHVGAGIQAACIVRPPGATRIGRLTKDAVLLKAADLDGQRAVADFIAFG